MHLEQRARSKIPISIHNSSDVAITLEPKSIIADLHLARPSVYSMNTIGSVINDSGDSPINDRYNEIWEKLNIDKSPATPTQIKELRDLLQSHIQAFALHKNELGHTNVVKHEIPLKDDKPFKDRYRRIPPNQYDEVRKCLQDMLESGAIRESHSPYASPIVVVKKKDGSIRLCIDYRKLNQDTVKDSYSLPRIEESLDALEGAKWFSSLDLQSGYWQIEVAEKDIPKTAFTTPMGFYECNRMPFGLTNAPATFQRLMEHCVGDMNYKKCLVYLDDVIIFSQTFEEHLERLCCV
ncbi:hypothetical protein BSL78_23185 [Apostichopus japonicus]|uniref:Reverse transcriptase domain-containing protein n=1 Tax=Stichopus japonicus TaxID=307972 RepID=A0A2G8JW73_STIJA|nr:hypothetical protein BSL78_23185 [Apostichopus japonicus]